MPAVVQRQAEEGTMNTDQHRLLKLLDAAEGEIVDAINSRAPADSVPDRIAIPILNRLEREEIETRDAFATVRNLIAKHL